MPNTGIRRSAISRISRRSNRSRRSASGRMFGCSIQPSRRGSRSAPPTSTTPSTWWRSCSTSSSSANGGNDDRNAPDFADRVVIAGCDKRERGLVSRRVDKIGVETNDRLRHCFALPFSASSRRMVASSSLSACASTSALTRRLAASATRHTRRLEIALDVVGSIDRHGPMCHRRSAGRRLKSRRRSPIAGNPFRSLWKNSLLMWPRQWACGECKLGTEFNAALTFGKGLEHFGDVGKMLAQHAVGKGLTTPKSMSNMSRLNERQRSGCRRSTRSPPRRCRRRS